MSRTTLDIDTTILEEIRRIQHKERRSMGKVVSELLADALAHRKEPQRFHALKWNSRPMRPLVDLSDKDAVYAALERDEG